ncbi:MAG: hypothetical protein QXF12_01700 [Candidatus Aenigmatarchaeota archaeon]
MRELFLLTIYKNNLEISNYEQVYLSEKINHINMNSDIENFSGVYTFYYYNNAIRLISNTNGLNGIFIYDDRTNFDNIEKSDSVLHFYKNLFNSKRSNVMFIMTNNRLDNKNHDIISLMGKKILFTNR